MNTWIIKTLKIRYLAYLIFVICVVSNAEPIELKGDQDGSYPEGEYLISEDVIVPSDKIMTLEAGAVLKFKPYTGLKVSGKLLCQGSSLKSILLTTYKNSDSSHHDEMSFIQWNGVEVDSGGAIDFDRVEIFNSVFGIKAHEKNDSLVLNDILFKNNTEDFRIGDSLIMVDNNSLYRGRFNASELSDSVGLLGKQKDRRKSKIVLQVSLASIGVAGAAIAGVYHYKHKDALDIANNAENNTNVVDNAYKDAEDFGTRRNIYGAIGAVSFTGLIITFFF